MGLISFRAALQRKRGECVDQLAELWGGLGVRGIEVGRVKDVVGAAHHDELRRSAAERLHRYLSSRGILYLVVDSASIAR